MVSLLWLGMMLVSAETVRAENKVMRTVSSAPKYRVTGPLVSVVTPVYNEESYLPSLLLALDNQTYINIEKIVIDNDSEDRTIEIANNLGAKVLVNHEFNIGMSRNIGASEASGEILVFMDADTVPDAGVIEKAVEELSNGSNLVTMNQCCTDSHLQGLMRTASGWLISPKNGAFIGVRRETFESVGGFDEMALAQEGLSEDTEFIASVLAKHGGLKHIRTSYVGVSARRQKVEGYVVSQHFQQRAIRGVIQTI